MICKFCGKELSDTAKFCNGCGAKVGGEDEAFVQETEAYESQTVQAAVIADEAPAYEQTDFENSHSRQENRFETEPAVNETESGSGGKKPRKRPNVFISILCVLFAFAFFGILIVLGGFLTVDYTTGEKAIERAVESVSFAEIEINYNGQNRTIAEAIAVEVTDSEVSEADIQKLVDGFEGDEYIVSVVTDLTDYVFNGGDAPELETDDIMGIIEENTALIEEVTGEKITESDLDEIEKSAEEMVGEFNKSIEDFDEIEQVNVFTARVSLRILIAVAVGMLAAILIVFILLYGFGGSGIYRAFRAFAIPTGLVGGLYLITGLVLPIVADIWASETDLIGGIISAVSLSLVYVGVTFLVACVVLIVLAVVFSIIYSAKRSEADGN